MRNLPRPTWLENFYGANLGFLNYEVLSIQHIPARELAKETELMESKWFDYRRLHPLQATYYFVKCYTDAYRAFCKKAIDHETAPYVRCIKEHDFLKAREKMSFWRLRAACDQVGIRYDFFLTFAMNWFYRFVGQDGKVYPPRPSHFAKNEELFADAVIAWEEQCRVSLQVAKDPYYRISNFAGRKAQQDHEAFVLRQIGQRAVTRYSLHAALYVYDVVRIEEALRSFESKVVEAAIALQPS